MRHLITTGILLGALGSNAQVAPAGWYDISPDWTTTGIDGNTYHLYEMLDNGYTVVLDFSTTWCPPCATLNWGRALDSLHVIDGPGGLNKVMVFLVESDPTTDMADLDGSSQGTPEGNTLGDWITGTTHPIIDDASIAELYHVIGYPTLYSICPSRMIRPLTTYNGWAGTYASLHEQCMECDHHEADSPHDATLLGANEVVWCAGPEVPLSTRLYNVGTEPITTATIEVVAENQNNEVVSTATWTGSLATYEQVQVDLPAWNAPPDGQMIHYRLATPDDDAANDSVLSQYMLVNSAIAQSNNVSMRVQTGDNADRIHWFLVRNDPFATVQVLDTGTYEDNTLYTHEWQLVSGGCYEVVIYSDSGFTDGAYFQLSDDGIPIIDTANASHQGGWGMDVYLAYFHVEGVTAVRPVEASATGIELLPGMERGVLRVRSDHPPSPGTMLTVRDAIGRVIAQQRITSQDVLVDIGEPDGGVYVATVMENGSIVSRKLMWP